jgi:hypothetical protein
MPQLLVLALAIGAFLALCAGMPRHQQALLGSKLNERATRRLRFLGWVLLACAFALAWSLFGFGRGTMIMAGCATIGALGAVITLNRRQT